MSRPRERDVSPPGGSRRWRIAGWGTVAFAVVCLAATPVVESALQAQGASLGAAESALGMVVWLGSWIGFPIVGAIVVHRQPHNFGQRLRDEVDLVTVATELRRTVSATIQPATTSVWLVDGEARP